MASQVFTTPGVHNFTIPDGVTDYLVGSGVFGTERQRTTYLTSKRIRNV